MSDIQSKFRSSGNGPVRNLYMHCRVAARVEATFRKVYWTTTNQKEESSHYYVRIEVWYNFGDEVVWQRSHLGTHVEGILLKDIVA